MQHYSREVERSQQLIDQLQVKALSYDAALIAIEACWDQVSFIFNFKPTFVFISHVLVAYLFIHSHYIHP